MSSFEEAQELAGKIRVVLLIELTEVESNVVGAQFGGEALATSVKAALIGLVLVMLFMIMYRVSGLRPSFSLHSELHCAVEIPYFRYRQYYPGIGMAVDANVITFARIHEVQQGMLFGLLSMRLQKALSAILDGNITTFIDYYSYGLGTGTVRVLLIHL